MVDEHPKYIDDELMSSDQDRTSAFLKENSDFIDDECEEGNETDESVKADFSDSEEERMYLKSKGKIVFIL